MRLARKSVRKFATPIAERLARARLRKPSKIGFVVRPLESASYCRSIVARRSYDVVFFERRVYACPKMIYIRTAPQRIAPAGETNVRPGGLPGDIRRIINNLPERFRGGGTP